MIRGEPATPASDVYAFAAMVFECLSGGPVFPRATQAAQLFAHTREPPPRLSRRRPELPSALDVVFERALAKDPGQRPTSATALMDEVAEALRGVELTELGPPPPPPAVVPSDTTVEALAGARAAALGFALLGGDSDPPASPQPAPLAGATVLGSDLVQPGQLRDCRGGRVTARSISCTIAQRRLPGATVVVPALGVVRRWSVRDARGEMALAVIRPREEGFHQIALSRNEFVSNAGVNAFSTDLAVEPGDVLALQLTQGSGVGARAGTGATTNRWTPQLRASRPPELPAGSGFDHELLLRVELIPGREQRLPRQVTGAAAAELERGRDVRRRAVRFANGRPVEIALVDVGGRLVLDMDRDGERVARMDLPGFRPAGGRLITFEVETDTSAEEKVGVYIEYANENSARILSHYADARVREFIFVN